MQGKSEQTAVALSEQVCPDQQRLSTGRALSRTGHYGNVFALRITLLATLVQLFDPPQVAIKSIRLRAARFPNSTAVFCPAADMKSAAYCTDAAGSSPAFRRPMS